MQAKLSSRRPLPFVRSALVLVFLSALGAASVYSQPLAAKETKTRPGLIRVNNQLPYSVSFDHPNGSAALVFDASYAFLATPAGLYRTALPLTSQSVFLLIGFQSKTIFNLYVHNGSLYVLKESIANQGTSATDHSFFPAQWDPKLGIHVT